MGGQNWTPIRGELWTPIDTKWYGRPTNQEVLPQMIDDTTYAWRTGVFEATRVFHAEDPGGPTFIGGNLRKPDSHGRQ